MKLLPFDTFEIQTSLTLEETITALEAEVEPKKWFRWFTSNHVYFEGEVSREGFKIMRIINYRNSFLPIIGGTFKQNQKGINVIIRMSLHPLVLAFMCLWFGSIIFGLFTVEAGAIRNNSLVAVPLLIMLIVGWVIVYGAFWFEARKAKPKLLSILNGQIKSEQIAQGDRE